MNVDGTEVTIEGAGDHALVFIHGWPDTARLWDRQVAALAGRYRCIRFTLPGFESGSRRAYGFADVIERIRLIVERTCPGEQVTLVLHDWGCLYGFLFAERHPALVARVVATDIGDAGSRRHRRELGIFPKLAVVSYQLYLATAWRIGGRIGNGMSRLFAGIVRAPAVRDSIHAGMAYPYAVTWFGVAGGLPTPPPRPPELPMLFIYGERKPFMFHSRAWAHELEARPGCRVVALPAGHWVMVSASDAFNAAVLAWLEDAR